jgi:Lrp/AsnC family leucine-responsive transcriptional regulator
MAEIKLDLKDRKILVEIEMNARISHASLAKKIGLSKQVIKYRIQRLEKEKIIQGYFAIIDVAKLGITPYIIYLQLDNLSSKEEEKWLEELEKNPLVNAVGKNLGDWDLTLVVSGKSVSEIDKKFRKITQGKTNKIKKKIITGQIESTYFTSKLLHNNQGKQATTDGSSEVNINEKDEKIIEILAKNGRENLIKIAEKLNMSANGIKERIKRLEKEKLIVAYKTKINYEKLGFLHFRVFLNLKNMNHEFYQRWITFLKNKGIAESTGRFWGYADIDFRIHLKTMHEFYELKKEIKEKFSDNIVSIESMIIVEWESINYFPK